MDKAKLMMIFWFVDIQVLWSQMQNVEIYLDF